MQRVRIGENGNLGIKDSGLWGEPLLSALFKESVKSSGFDRIDWGILPQRDVLPRWQSDVRDDSMHGRRSIWFIDLEVLKDMGEGNDRDNAIEVEPRRIRWYLKSRFLDDRLRVELQINTVPKSLEILDYWGEWRFFDQLQMRLGQFKEPFTRYRQQSFSSSLLAEWANVTPYFGADRQMGVMFHNSDAKPRFEYALAVFSGQNLRRAQAVEAANTVYGERIPSA